VIATFDSSVSEGERQGHLVMNRPLARSPSFSLEAQILNEGRIPRISPGRVMSPKAETVRQAIFNNRSQLKIYTASVAMHLSRKRRDDIFKQIDELLDIDNWSDEDVFISFDSYRTLIRAIISVGLFKRAALTVATSGNIQANWFLSDRRLTIECLSQDNFVLLAYYRPIGEAPRVINRQSALEDLRSTLDEIKATSWCMYEAV